MSERRLPCGLALLTALAAFSSVVSASTDLFDSVKRALVCSCACAMTVDVCEGAMSCGEAATLARETKELIEGGMDRAAVLATLVARHGESVLAAPTKRGFNLAAWVLPFVAIIVAGIGVVFALRRWTRPTGRRDGIPRAVAAEMDGGAYGKRLDEVLRALD